MENHVTSRTRGLVLVTPNNPTGAVYPRSALEQLAEVAIRRDLVIISDESYEKLVFAAHRHWSIGSLPGMQGRTITINGFSKAYSMTGWRVGYLAGPAHLVEAVGSLHHTLAICAPAFAQTAAEVALRGPQTCVADVVRAYHERSRVFVRGLRSIGLDAFEPQGTFFVLGDIRALGISSQAFVERLLDEVGVLVYPGSYLGPAGEGYFRASLIEPPPRLLEAVERMEGAPVVRGGSNATRG